MWYNRGRDTTIGCVVVSELWVGGRLHILISRLLLSVPQPTIFLGGESMAENPEYIWERLPGEPSYCYALFCIYRDLGPQRSYNRVAKESGKGVRRIEAIGSKWNWVRRAEAYDNYLEKRRREEKERQIEEMAERHAKIAMEALEKVQQRLKTLDPKSMSAATLAKLFEVATKVERLSRGEPVEEGAASSVVVNIHAPDA